MPDLLIVDTGDGGEAVTYSAPENTELRMDSGLTTAIYVSLFTGVSWADSLKKANETITGAGNFERELRQPITTKQIGRIKSAADVSLRWLVDTRICSSVTVSVTNPRIGYVKIEVKCTQPRNADTIYSFMWSQAEYAIVEGIRNG